MAATDVREITVTNWREVKTTFRVGDRVKVLPVGGAEEYAGKTGRVWMLWPADPDHGALESAEVRFQDGSGCTFGLYQLEKVTR